MIAKTLSGIPMLDQPHGGIFSNRSFLVTGARDAGKTVMGLQFIRQGLEQNERCLYLSTMVADDLAILASSFGFDLTSYVASEALTLLEYETFMSGSGSPGQDMLPPEGFEQLKDIINSSSIERVVLDTVLPWVSVREPDRMSQQIFSFTRSFDRLGVTTMLTLPKPVSSLAFRLKKSIEDIVPVSVLLQPPSDREPAMFQVVKYLGEKKLEGKRPFLIEEGVGIRATSPQEFSEQQSSLSNASSGPTEKPRPTFSSVAFDASKPKRSNSDPSPEQPPAAPPRQAPPKPSRSFVQQTPEAHSTPAPDLENSEEESPASPKTENDSKPPASGGARLSSIWKPQTESR